METQELKGRCYDFSVETDLAEQISVELEVMSQQQLTDLKKQVDRIFEESDQEKKRKNQTWFEAAVIPILKEFAEESGAVLRFETESDSMVFATLHNRKGFDIAFDHHRMRAVLFLAGYISIEREGDEAVLTLSFSFDNLKC